MSYYNSFTITEFPLTNTRPYKIDTQPFFITALTKAIAGTVDKTELINLAAPKSFQQQLSIIASNPIQQKEGLIRLSANNQGIISILHAAPNDKSQPDKKSEFTQIPVSSQVTNAIKNYFIEHAEICLGRIHYYAMKALTERKLVRFADVKLDSMRYFEFALRVGSKFEWTTATTSNIDILCYFTEFQMYNMPTLGKHLSDIASDVQHRLLKYPGKKERNSGAAIQFIDILQDKRDPTIQFGLRQPSNRQMYEGANILSFALEDQPQIHENLSPLEHRLDHVAAKLTPLSQIDNTQHDQDFDAYPTHHDANTNNTATGTNTPVPNTVSGVYVTGLEVIDLEF